MKNDNFIKECEYLRAMLRYKRWEKSLKDIPKRKRNQILKGYDINRPSLHSSDITYRALMECSR